MHEHSSHNIPLASRSMGRALDWHGGEGTALQFWITSMEHGARGPQEHHVDMLAAFTIVLLAHHLDARRMLTPCTTPPSHNVTLHNHTLTTPLCLLTHSIRPPTTTAREPWQASGFPCNTDDVKFYRTAREDIGEAIPLTDESDSCKHPYLVPNVNRKACVLPGRIDIGRHFILTGGLQGLKESHERLVSRVLSFGR